ncbi:histone acetyltransferase KAT6B-like [Perca fluviatilis]|uniref:histone acetyltransferase KAT6B-like n=1 Tax=Perca fluviatilis TaxID=8168 RepID=UPI001963B97B|nr:histone acetyltransferase KAT6B-like [Perca fluviatilis]
MDPENKFKLKKIQESEGDVEAQIHSLIQRAECRLWNIRKRPNHSTTSKVAYFKRKYAEEEDLHGGLRGYFQKHLILQEDRSCILKLSLEKLRFLEDPEAYLRRSVLINNLLRKIHHEEEELEAEEEEEEEEEEDEVEEEEEEVGEEEAVIGERGQRKLLYPDRKRLKVLVMDCCSPAFGLEELQHYRLVPCYPSALYSLGTCPGLAPNHQVLLYNLDDNG